MVSRSEQSSPWVDLFCTQLTELCHCCVLIEQSDTQKSESLSISILTSWLNWTLDALESIHNALSDKCHTFKVVFIWFLGQLHNWTLESGGCQKALMESKRPIWPAGLLKRKNYFALCRMNFKPVSASEWWEVVVRMFNAFLAFIGWCQCDNRPNVSNVWKYWDLRDNVASVSCINNLYRRQQGPVSLYQHGISFICTGSRETQTNNCNCLPRTPKVLAERAAKYRKIIDLQRGQKQGMLKKEEAMEHQRNRWIDES